MSRKHSKKEIAEARDVVQTDILHKFGSRAIKDGFDVRDIDEKPETWHFRQGAKHPGAKPHPAQFRSLHSFPFAFGITVVLGRR